MQVGYVMRTRAYRTGYEVFHSETTHRVRKGSPITEQRSYVRVPQGPLIDVEVWGGTEEGERLVTDILNMKTASDVGSLASRYGDLSYMSDADNDDRFDTYDVRRQLYLRDALAIFIRGSQEQDFTMTLEGLKLMDVAPSVDFQLMLSPASKSWVPVLETRTPIMFAAVELMSSMFAGQKLFVCEQCRRFNLAKKRSGSKFCSVRCRVANNRGRHNTV
jgi:hypothetical protein